VAIFDNLVGEGIFHRLALLQVTKAQIFDGSAQSDGWGIGGALFAAENHGGLVVAHQEAEITESPPNLFVSLDGRLSAFVGARIVDGVADNFHLGRLSVMVVVCNELVYLPKANGSLGGTDGKMVRLGKVREILVGQIVLHGRCWNAARQSAIVRRGQRREERVNRVVDGGTI